MVRKSVRYAFTRGEPELKPGNTQTYNGVDYKARFSCTKSIVIRSVMFFGRLKDSQDLEPAIVKSLSDKGIVLGNPSRRIITVRIAIVASEDGLSGKVESGDGQIFCPQTDIEVDVTDAVKKTRFLVDLPECRVIPANTVFDIRFQLDVTPDGDGDTEFYGLPLSQNLYKKHAINGQREGKIEAMSGSKQCAGFLFEIHSD